MAINAKNYDGGGKKFAPPPVLPAGARVARLVQLITTGLQPRRAFKGEEKSPMEHGYFTYELGDEFMLDEDGEEIEDKPRWISETLPLFSLDSDLATSTKRYYAFDQECEDDGDWIKQVGKPIMVPLVDKAGTSADDVKNKVRRNYIKETSALTPKAIKRAVPLVNDPKIFDIDEPDMEIFFSLPQWLQDKMTTNLRFGGSTLETAIDEYKEPKGKKDKKKSKKKEEVAEKASDDEEDW